MILSKKQIQLYKDIISPNVPYLSIEGSTQSGKTYDICAAMVNYAQVLRDYEKEQRKNPLYIARQYYGAIIGWTTDTLNGNIVENLNNILETEYHLKKGKDYELKFGNSEKYLKIYGIKFFFFGFNTYLAFNKILGKPLIFVWVDESARIYTQKNLQEQFNQLAGRQMSYASNPYLKTIHSFNVEGGENHDYKLDYLDKKIDKKNYIFFPYDNPKIDTPEAIQKVIELFPPGSLREQKVFNKWIVGEGRVFNTINVIDNIEEYHIREIGIGIDYGSKNATTFVPIALAQHKSGRWQLIRLQIYKHNSREIGDTPTTEYYSNQLKLFIKYIKEQYKNIPITTIVIDSEAAHFDNRLKVDNIPHDISKKGPDSVREGVEHLQSLIYKELFLILKSNSIKHINENLTLELSGKDDGIVEYESYQYDTVRSTREGIDCFKKEFDHCLTGDTLIKTNKGDIPIKDLVNTKGKV